MSDGEREPTAATMFPWMQPDDRRAAAALLGYPASSLALMSSPDHADAPASPGHVHPAQSLLDDELHGLGQFRFDSPKPASHAVRSPSAPCLRAAVAALHGAQGAHGRQERCDRH